MKENKNKGVVGPAVFGSLTTLGAIWCLWYSLTKPDPAGGFNYIGFYMGLFLIVISLVSFGVALVQRKKNIKRYEKLYATYPELNGSLEHLHQLADYFSEPIGLFLYKEGILSFQYEFNFLMLPELAQLKITKQWVKITKHSRILHLYLTYSLKGSDKLYSIGLGRLEQEKYREARKFLGFISQRAPQIQLQDEIADEQ